MMDGEVSAYGLLATQQDAQFVVLAAQECLALDEWALVEARLLQTLLEAGCALEVARLVMNGDDARLVEVN